MQRWRINQLVASSFVGLAKNEQIGKYVDFRESAKRFPGALGRLEGAD